jgi:hypothetical protein
MRTTRRSDEAPGDDTVTFEVVPEPFPSDRERLAEKRRRLGTLAFFAGIAALALAAWLLRGGSDGPPTHPAAVSGANPEGPPLDAGTYRLPGLSTPVSVTVPDGWFAGTSSWGAPGLGFAAMSTGRAGASISVAVFDLARLHPADPASDAALGRPGDRVWFARSLDEYHARVEPRVRDRVVGSRLEWRPPPVLAWLLTLTDRGQIDVAADVTYDGLSGDLVSFAFPGPRRALFEVPGAGTLALRPGVSYTFWVPRSAPGTGSSVAPLMLGIARELGAAPTTAEWDVVRTLEFGG